MGDGFEGLDELLGKIDTVITEFPNAKHQALRITAEMAKKATVKNTPKDTGLLVGSWKIKNGDNGEVVLYNNTEYAAHIEYGHRVGKSRDKFVKGFKMLHRGIQSTNTVFESKIEKAMRELLQ